MPYERSQWWAQALHDTVTELDGIRFEPRHAVGRRAAAVFGRRGAADWEADDPTSLTPQRVRHELRGTGAQVLTPP